MVIRRNNECPQINIFIDRNKLKQKDEFKYLGTKISSDGCNNIEIELRIEHTKKNFQTMKSLLTNKYISIHTIKVLECYIEPLLMYGCEAWTISKQLQKKLKKTEMWFLWIMLQISWTAKISNSASRS